MSELHLPPGEGLIETMRVEGGRVVLLERHLDRLTASADAFGVSILREALRERIEAEHGDGVLRVRLGAGGEIDVDRRKSDPPFRTVALFPEPMEAGGPLWRHKTTQRAPYNRALEWARAVGVDEPILMNTSGEVIEGARTSVWIRDGERWITPPLASGGLPGVYRSFWLSERSDTVERRLTPETLQAASEIILTNAARGPMPVALLRSV